VDFFDADCGTNGATSNDYRIGGSGTTTTYSLYSPAGGGAVQTRTSGQAWAVNNNWANFHTVASPAAGHWRLVISSLAGGDDMNGYGIRAHDGTSGAGGTELNIYGYSYISCGWVGTGSWTSTRYPYITSGCSMDWNDWDGDNLSSHTLRSRNGLVSTTFNGSANNIWKNTPVANYDSDLVNNETGIWTWTGVYTDTGGGAGNYGILYAGNYNYGSPPPTSQPLTDTFRIYFPTDNGGVPSKPGVYVGIVHACRQNANQNLTRSGYGNRYIPIDELIVTPVTRGDDRLHHGGTACGIETVVGCALHHHVLSNQKRNCSRSTRSARL
jgi:hypothetical protein